MRHLHLLTWRSLQARPLRAALCLFAIALGVATILAIDVTNRTALQSITRLLDDTSGKASLVVVSVDAGEQGIPQQVVETAATVRGVSAAVPLLRVQTNPSHEAVEDEIGLSMFGATAGGLLLYGVDPRVEPIARDYELVAGRFLATETDAAEIVLVDEYAADKNVGVGKWFDIATPTGTAQLRVVGLIAAVGPGRVNNGAFGLIPLSRAQDLFNRHGEIDEAGIVLEAEPGTVLSREDIQNVKQRLESRLGQRYPVIFPASQGERMTQMLSSYQIGLNFLSGIALFAGAFLVYNAFAMTIAERTREFGMLRTIGMTRRQVALQVLTEAVVYGTLGSLVGLGLGTVMSRGLAHLMAMVLGQELGVIAIPARALLLPFGIGLGTTLLAAAIPALQAGRISPLEALRIRGGDSAHWIARHGHRIGLLLLSLSIATLVWNPFPYDVQFRLGSVTVFALFAGATLTIPKVVKGWERIARPALRAILGDSASIGGRNIDRAPLRTTLTVAALTIGISMILVVQGMTASFSSDLREWLESYIGGDVYVSSATPIRSDVWRRVESVEGVEVIAPVRYLEVTWLKPDGSSQDLSFMAVEPSSYSRVTRFVFDDAGASSSEALLGLVQGDAVFISSVISEKYELHPGDVMMLRTRVGARPFTVAAVVVDFFNQGLVIEGSWNDMRRYFGINDANTLLVKVGEGFDPDEVEAEIDRLHGSRYRLIIESNQSIRGRTFSLMDQAFQMFDLLAILAVLVGALSVANTMTVNVLERTREIGMLRSIGMTRPQVTSMVLAEAGSIGLVGGILGVACGATLTRVFLLGMTSMSGYKLNLVLPLTGILKALAAGLFMSLLAAALPAVRAARTRILSAIQFE